MSVGCRVLKCSPDWNTALWMALSLLKGAHYARFRLFFREMSELREQLCDEAHMAHVRANVWNVREPFTFDYHADRLIALFREVIAQ